MDRSSESLPSCLPRGRRTGRSSTSWWGDEALDVDHFWSRETPSSTGILRVADRFVGWLPFPTASTDRARPGRDYNARYARAGPRATRGSATARCSSVTAPHQPTPDYVVAGPSATACPHPRGTRGQLRLLWLSSTGSSCSPTRTRRVARRLGYHLRRAFVPVDRRRLGRRRRPLRRVLGCAPAEARRRIPCLRTRSSSRDRA